MRITLKRRYRKENYTIGDLYINGMWFSNTLEDKDRGLTSAMTENEIFDIKVAGKTAIPIGTYKVAYTFSPKYHRYMPLIQGVKGFSGIRIHSGNTDKDTEGCLLLGQNKKVGQVINSRAICSEFYRIVENALDNLEQITIEII